VFRTGKMIVTGAKKQEDSETAAKKFVKIIERVGFAATYSDHKVQNISATIDVGFPIRLEGLMLGHPNNSTYEPELFPGLVYRLTEPKIVFLIFVSGKIVITGAKNTQNMVEALQILYPTLLPFKKSSVILNM
jgi:transcription initiation factor TFIID TATA-box-binding protein